MDATQLMCPPDSDPDFPDENDVDENAKIVYGVLKLLDAEDQVQGKEYKVRGGETKIGRDPDECNVVIDNKVRINNKFIFQ